MTNYLQLADLLEQAAKALREAHAKLSEIKAPVLDPIDRHEFSVRARKAIMRMKIESYGQLADKTVDEVRSCRNTGMTTIAEMRAVLARRGLAFKGDDVQEFNGCASST